MKSLKVLLAMLVLAVAVVGCRSVPVDVSEAHIASMIRSNDALDVAEQTLKAVEAQSVLLNDALVDAAFQKWTRQIERTMTARGVVHKYLLDTKVDLEVSSAYSTGHKLLVDMHANFSSVKRFWEEMIMDENAQRRDLFIRLFRDDIQRFNTLERKFDEWISQFKVKG